MTPEQIAQLTKDDNGDIVITPVAEWMTAALGGTGVLLAIRHVENLGEVESGGKWVQLGLTPRQCLELSGVLKRAAEILESPPPGTPLN
jgi:hypothetical protein